MDQDSTIVLLVAGIVVAATAIIGDRLRRGAPLAWHAYVPWNAAVFVGLTMALFSAVHLLTLLRA